MTAYTVDVAEVALSAIAEQARYIAVEAKAPLNAERWLNRIWDAADTLEQFPRRAPLAEEDAYVEYEVRQLVVGSHLLLFTVDDESRTVIVLGLRHGRRLARPDELAETPPTSDRGEGDV